MTATPDPSLLSDSELIALCKETAEEKFEDRHIFASLFLIGVPVFFLRLQLILYAVVSLGVVGFAVWWLVVKRVRSYRRRTRKIKEELARRFELPNFDARRKETNAQWAVSIEMRILPAGYQRSVQIYIFDGLCGELRVAQKPWSWAVLHNTSVRKTIELKPEYAIWLNSALDRIAQAGAITIAENRVIDGSPTHFRAVQRDNGYYIEAKFNRAGLTEESRGHPVVSLINKVLDVAFANEPQVIMGAYNGKEILIEKL